MCKRFIVCVLHRTTWRGSIVSLKCATKTTITGICWWDFIETHVYHIIQNTIFPKKFLLHRLQAPVSLPDIFSGFNSYDAGDPHTKQTACILLNHLGVTECKRTTLCVNGRRSICFVVFLGWVKIVQLFIRITNFTIFAEHWLKWNRIWVNFILLHLGLQGLYWSPKSTRQTQLRSDCTEGDIRKVVCAFWLK